MLYHLECDTDVGCALRDVLAEHHIPALTVRDDQLGERVGRLAAANAGVRGAPVSEPPPQAPFLLFCALGDRQLERLLAAMRRVGISVPYKAILTERNRNWTLSALIKAVSEEHEAMQHL